MNQRIIIIGGVGSGTVIAQAIKDANLKGDNSIQLEGFMSHDKNPGEVIENIPVIASQSPDNVNDYYNKGYKFIFALHRTDEGEKFIDLFKQLNLSEEKLITFRHPTAYIAPDVKIGNGSVIMPYVMISSHAKIGLSSLIMTGVTIGHNTILGEFNHVASQAVVGAFIQTGIGTHIGLNSTIREYLSLGSYSTLGMGAVLTKNMKDKEIWAGNPAKYLRNAR